MNNEKVATAQKLMMLSHEEEIKEWCNTPEEENVDRDFIINNLDRCVSIIVRDIEWQVVSRHRTTESLDFIPREFTMFSTKEIKQICENEEAFRNMINEYLYRMYNTPTFAFVHSIQPITFRNEDKEETGKGLKVRIVLNYTNS